MSFYLARGTDNYGHEEVTTDAQHPYKVNGQLVDYELKLKHGSSEKKFQIDKISNSPFTDVSSFIPDTRLDENHPLEGVRPPDSSMRSGEGEGSF